MAPSKPTLDLTHPALALQWHSENSKLPSDVTSGSGYRAKWLCEKDGYTWDALVSNRAKNGSGCPLCANRVVVPGHNDLASKFPDIAAEWHPDNDKLPTEVSPGGAYRAKWICAKGHTWDIPVCNRTGSNSNSGCPVCAGKAVAPGVNDLASQYPHVAAEWSPENAKRADEVSEGSHMRAKWVCAEGHQWEATVETRTRGGLGCGKCSGRHVDTGVNDLATLHPEIAAEWGPENEKPASSYRPGSNYSAQWKCALGHTWRTTVANRTKQGTGCPTCSNKEVLAGFNDLSSIRPDLASQWCPGNTKSPAEVGVGSEYLAKWECPAGHTWDAVVVARTRMGTGCPYCSGRRAVEGLTDIATTHPHLLTEWSPTNTVPLSALTAGSDHRGEWVCAAKGHTWQTQVKHRALGGQGCPECARSAFSSKGEKELLSLIQSIVGAHDVLPTYRGVPNAGEVDVFVPSLNMAFEYNGVYYHSDALGRDPHSHFNKFRACKDAGVQLIVVWEDDWRDRRAVVEAMVRAKLGDKSIPPIGARKLSMDKCVKRGDADELLLTSHIQGAPMVGTVYVGLRDHNGELQAVAVGRRRGAHMVMERYASRVPVLGGLQRLLREMRYQARELGCLAVATYSDNSVSDGEVYARAGFARTADIRPKYGVVWKSTRHHSSTMDRDRFRKDPALKYTDGMRLVDLYRLNGMHRYWDYGKVRWEMPC